MAENEHSDNPVICKLHNVWKICFFMQSNKDTSEELADIWEGAQLKSTNQITFFCLLYKTGVSL